MRSVRASGGRIAMSCHAGSRCRSYQATYSSTIARVAGCVVTSSMSPSPITQTRRPSRSACRYSVPVLILCSCSRPVAGVWRSGAVIATRTPGKGRGAWQGRRLGLGLERFGDGLGHVEELAADLWVGYRVVEPDELDRFGALQILAPLPVFVAYFSVVRPQITKKIRYRHPQDVGHRRQP